MAKTGSIERNKKRQRLVKSYKAKRGKLSAIVKNKNLPLGERISAQIKLSELPRNSAKVRLRNRCALTGRPRGYFRKFALCRNALRQLASFGQIPGVIKASW
jgi:small subunit ribosomal protein S14